MSRYGVVAFGSSLDQVGPFGRTVEDVALAMNALYRRGPRSVRLHQPGLRRRLYRASQRQHRGQARGHYPRVYGGRGPDARRSRPLFQRAAQELQNQGAELVEVDLPAPDAAIAAYYVIGPAEAFSNLARFDGIRYGYQEEGCANLSDQSSLSAAPTALAPRPSAVRCSAPTC